MNKRSLLSITVVPVLSLSLFLGTGLAAGTPINDHQRVIDKDPGHKFEIPITMPKEVVEAATKNAVTQSFPEASAHKTNLKNDRGNIQLELSTNYSDIYTGAYTDENGKNVFLVTKLSEEVKNKVKGISAFPDNIEFSVVKYSRKQLMSAKEKLSSVSTTLGLEGVGVNPKLNKVNVYISQEIYDSKKNEVLKHIDEDMVNWIIGDLELDTQAYNLFPGEKIERGSSATAPACSLGFNGRADSQNVGVTAGHCLNGTWYDQSDGTSSIGTMNNAVFSDTSLFDAGYIVYNTSVIPSHVLNGNTLTIGTTDYAGYYREVGDKVRVHGFNGNGNSYPEAEILDTSYDAPGGPTDLILTGLSGTQDGDSGGLVYNVVNNGTKNYARIEGTHTGVINQSGTPKWQVFSKYSYVISQLGVTGVYTDSSY